jgi:hypothetical protein
VWRRGPCRSCRARAPPPRRRARRTPGSRTPPSPPAPGKGRGSGLGVEGIRRCGPGFIRAFLGEFRCLLSASARFGSHHHAVRCVWGNSGCGSGVVRAAVSVSVRAPNLWPGRTRVLWGRNRIAYQRTHFQSSKYKKMFETKSTAQLPNPTMHVHKCSCM